MTARSPPSAMPYKQNIFKFSTGFAGVYHVILGLIGLTLPQETVLVVIETVMNVSVSPSAEFGVIILFASVYMLAFGLMLLLLCSNPSQYRLFCIPVLVLFGIRLINRTVFFSTIATAFGTSWSQNIPSILIMGFIFISILLTMPKKGELWTNP